MSETTDLLKRARGVAWESLVPAFDHALVLALEAEHAAGTASMQVLSNIPPEYPPLVELLAKAGE